VVAFRMLREFYEAGHSNSEGALRDWYFVASRASWRSFADVRRDFANVDQVGDRLVFNIGGNKYRLVAVIDYANHGVLVRFIGTHAEYDRIDVRTI